MDSQAIIDRAYQIIATSGVHRGSYAIDSEGRSCPTAEGVKFCSAGALARAAIELGLYEDDALDEAARRFTALISTEGIFGEWAEPSITGWNDNIATDEQILDTFRRIASPTVMTEAVTV